MKAEDFRIGNYHYYHIKDKFDERKEWDEICNIDAEDLVWLSKPEGEADPDYNPIPLTEERLLKFGFEKRDECYVISDDLSHYIELLNIRDEWYPWLVELPELSHQSEQKVCIPYIKYVHQLQNLYFALTGNELTIKL